MKAKWPRIARGAVALVFVGLVCAVTITTFDRFEEDLQTEEQKINVESIEFVVSSLKVNVDMAEACTHMFKGLKPIPGQADEASLDYTYDPFIPGPLRSGATAANGVLAESVQVTLSAHPDMAIAAPGGNGQLLRYPANLRLRLNLRFESSARFRSEPNIPLYIWLNPAGQIDSCHGPESVATFCNSTGGYYLTDPKEGPRCHTSAFTQKLSGREWSSWGSCRYGGVVERAEDCAKRGSGDLEAIPAQQAYAFGESYICMTCD